MCNLALATLALSYIKKEKEKQQKNEQVKIKIELNKLVSHYTTGHCTLFKTLTMASAPSSPETPPNTNFTATSTPPLKISPATLPNPNNKRLLIGLSIGFALLSFVLILVIAFLVYFLHRVRKNKRHKSFGRIPLQGSSLSPCPI